MSRAEIYMSDISKIYTIEWDSYEQPHMAIWDVTEMPGGCYMATMERNGHTMYRSFLVAAGRIWDGSTTPEAAWERARMLMAESIQELQELQNIKQRKLALLMAKQGEV